ncbi:MAG: pyruvate formate lyase family protein, partial [Anaerolineae bacterium]
MLALSERVLQQRERALAWQETQRPLIGQRLVPALQGLAGSPPGTPWMMRKAQMLASVIRGSVPLVQERELLVGYNFPGGDDEQWLEMTMARPDLARRAKLEAYLSKGALAEEQVEAALATLDGLDSMVPGVSFVPGPEPLAAKAPAEGLYWCQATAYNHTVIGYARVLEEGFLGLADEVRERLAGLEISSTEDLQARMVLESMLVVAEAGAQIGERYAAHVHALREGCADPGRAAELAALEDVLRHVPARPARTFHEALQSLWF